MIGHEYWFSIIVFMLHPMVVQVNIT
jgi:hypothetical protein